MKKTIDYLEELLLRNNKTIKNDSQLAHLIGITRQAISQYRTGQSMNPFVCVRVATLLDISPMETISAAMFEAAKTEKEREFWKGCYDKYKTAKTI